MSTAPFLPKQAAPLKGPCIVGFNGPPKAGKDTIATGLIRLLDSATSAPVQRQALAATMRDGACAILGLTGGDKWYNDIKDVPLQVIDGDTFRDFMIKMSEEFVKKCYGKGFWAKLMHGRNISWWDRVPTILIVTDIGFPDEVDYLCEHSERYLNIVLDRANTDFSKDSRRTVWAGQRGGTDLVVSNNGTVEEAASKILHEMYRLGFPVL